jgi:hypothetical protein
MTRSRDVRFRLLRVVLLFCSLTWGASLFGVFASWDAAARALEGLGAKPIAYDPMLDYWLRMAAGAFGLVGLGYLLLALNPCKHAGVLPWAGWLMVVEGTVLACHGFRLGLPPFPFYADVSACFLGGFAILTLRNVAEPGAS